jgi:hypothetical protein
VLLKRARQGRITALATHPRWAHLAFPLVERLELYVFAIHASNNFGSPGDRCKDELESWREKRRLFPRNGAVLAGPPREAVNKQTPQFPRSLHLSPGEPSPRTTKLYDRTSDQVDLGEIEKIQI